MTTHPDSTAPHRMNVDRLYQEHRRPLYRYLVRLTGDPELAEDALQETFHRLLKSPPSGGGTRAWLYTVATNLVREAGRSRARHLRLLSEAGEPLGHGKREASPEAAVAARERGERVHRALAGLPERDRMLLLLYGEGLKHREIAGAVGTTTRSVGTMIARALRRLSEMLDARPEDLS